METCVVHSIGELIEEVRALITKTGLKWWFRGHACASWTLVPRVRRGYTLEQEKELTNEFRLRTALRYSRPPDGNDYAGWLALMQHYGLPTRLLDWSRSPLVAAYFATESSERHSSGPPLDDACIWALTPSQLNESMSLKQLLYPLNAEELVHCLKPAIQGSDTHEREFAAVPSETDLRMLMQQGAFTIHTSKRLLTDIPGADELLRQFIIPADALPHMRSDLEILSIRLGDVFPDLTHLAAELSADHKTSSGRAEG
jgi:FRG domain